MLVLYTNGGIPIMVYVRRFKHHHFSVMVSVGVICYLLSVIFSAGCEVPDLKAPEKGKKHEFDPEYTASELSVSDPAYSVGMYLVFSRACGFPHQWLPP